MLSNNILNFLIYTVGVIIIKYLKGITTNKCYISGYSVNVFIKKINNNS